MILPISIKLLEDYTKNLEKRLRELQKQSVFWGMDSSQGEHYSGFSYVGLFKYLSQGDPDNNIPARPALQVAYTFNPLSSSPVKKDLTKYFSNIKHTNAPIKAEKIPKNLGIFYRKVTYNVFGDATRLAANSGFTQAMKAKDGVNPANQPLVWTGDLKSKIGYSVNGKKILSFS